MATQYRAEPKLAMWVPTEMREEYSDLTGPPVFLSPSEATARYSNFRRFTVTIEDTTARLPEEPAEPPPQGPPAESAEPRPPGPAVETPAPVPHAESTARALAPHVPPTFASAVS